MSNLKDNKVSIVLPVYNGETNVGNAIESVLRQTHQNLELIIVNDCSTDNTLAALEKYAAKDNRIKIVSNPVNLKLPRSLNVGFEQATGKFYSWTSDDNLYKENAIERMVLALETNQSADMVYADYTTIDEAGKKLHSFKLGDCRALLRTNPIGACFLYTSEIARKVGAYDANLFLAEDYDYWIRIWRKGRILHLDEDLYYYRVHDGSLTATKKDLIGLQTYKTLEKNFLFLYANANSKKEKYLLLDQMLNRLDNHEQKEFLRMAQKTNRGYRCHIKAERLKDNMRGSFLWKILRKIKRKLQK